jgi:hypothetical protein
MCIYNCNQGDIISVQAKVDGGAGAFLASMNFVIINIP